MSAFARNLKRIRESQGMTLTSLAKELKLSLSTVSLYEKGEREPSLSKVQKLADIFNVTVNELFEGMNDVDRDSEMALFLKQYEKAKLRWESCGFTIKVEDNGFITIKPPNDIFCEDTPMFDLELKKTDFVRLTLEMEHNILLARKKDEEFKLMTRVIMSVQAAKRRINPHNLVGHDPLPNNALPEPL